MKPTKAQRAYLSRIADIGCIVCKNTGHEGTPAEIHHKTGGGMGMKSDEIMPLCPPHHRTGGYGVAVHSGEEEWERRYGTQSELAQQVRDIMEFKTKGEV